jgi:hypothetical protein
MEPGVEGDATTSGGASQPEAAGCGGRGRPEGTAQALGPGSPRTGSGRGRSSKSGASAHSRGCAAAPPSGWSGGARRWGAPVGRPRGSRLRRELSRADLPDDCRTPVCRVGPGRRNHGAHLHRPVALGTAQRIARRARWSVLGIGSAASAFPRRPCCVRSPRVRRARIRGVYPISSERNHNHLKGCNGTCGWGRYCRGSCVPTRRRTSASRSNQRVWTPGQALEPVPPHAAGYRPSTNEMGAAL